MNDTVTILGRVGNDPIRSETTSGVPVVNFRMASPQRRYDAKTQAWVETGTNWYTVSAFRQLAEHVKSSVHSGDGVIVTGRLRVREWENNGRKGTSVDIEADAIGHDLRWGTSAYAKASRLVTPAAPAERRPADDHGTTEEPYGSSAEGDEQEREPAMVLSNSWAQS